MVAHIVICTPLLRANKMLEFHWIAYEENRRVVSHHVEVAFDWCRTLMRIPAGLARYQGFRAHPQRLKSA